MSLAQGRGSGYNGKDYRAGLVPVNLGQENWFLRGENVHVDILDFTDFLCLIQYCCDHFKLHRYYHPKVQVHKEEPASNAEDEEALRKPM